MNSNLKSDGVLKCDRAKTAMQLKRDGSLVRACELFKKDIRCRAKKIEICWKKEGIKDRAVEIDGQPAFMQNSTDLSGSFAAQFQDLSF